MKSLNQFLLVLTSICLLFSCTNKKMVQKTKTMEPTIKEGETVEISTGAYSAALPARWDVITFRSPKGEGQWCFRIVGLPGEEINITADGITIDGRVVTPPSHLKSLAYNLPRKGPGVNVADFPYMISKNSVFVIGDNVNEAYDSRYWGGLNTSMITGKVIGK